MIFDSAREKIARAQRHLFEFDSLEQAYLRNKSSGIIMEDDPATGLQAIKIKFSEPIPLQCAGIVSDSANNFRDALDHMLYAVAVASGKVQPRHTNFPFARDPADLEKVIHGRTKDLPDSILSLLRA